MCNCKRNTQTKQCEPVLNHLPTIPTNTNYTNTNSQPFSNNTHNITNITSHEPFPFFAFGTGSPDTHSEQVLLPHIAWEARQLMDQYNSKFYLYSFNSPSDDP